FHNFIRVKHLQQVLQNSPLLYDATNLDIFWIFVPGVQYQRIEPLNLIFTILFIPSYCPTFQNIKSLNNPTLFPLNSLDYLIRRSHDIKIQKEL
ncbi:hypothetical protein KJ032_27020, partial [Salmonella enterica subsp. enterica serovar Typhimurium]|nr:hypothetical protein [Salmonella enterica subsp. enterica serovar Typhimurium]